MRKIDWPFAFAITALASVLIAIILEDYPRYAECPQQQANPDSLCHLPWWNYSGAWVAIFTIVLTASTALLWWTTRKALRHSQKSADAAVAAQRAWIKIDIAVAGNLQRRSTAVHLEFAVTVENIGHSPATNVQIWVPIVCGGTGINFGDAINKIPPHAENVGVSLFPNKPETISRWGMLTNDEIESALSDAQSTHHINIGAVASATYRFAGGEGNTRKLYRLLGPHFLQTVDVRKLPIDRSELAVEAVPVGDTIS